MISNFKAEKFSNNLQGAFACIQDFRGDTIKQLRHHVIRTLVDDTQDVAVIHGECN